MRVFSLVLQSWALSRFVTSLVDRSFDEQEFLEGSKDAYFMGGCLVCENMEGL